MKTKPQLNVALRGEYRVVLNDGTEREVDSGWMPNLITDFGMDSLATDGQTRGYYCSVGTGTSAPANADTSLQSFLASKAQDTNASSVDSTTPYAVHVNNSYLFALGAVVGNITEIGIGSANNGTSLFSRCRVIDGAGSPTSLTVTSIDQLTIYYRLNLTSDVTDATGSVTLASVAYAYTARKANATAAPYLHGILGIYGSAIPRIPCR
jgi:hypothetical protein